MKLFTIGLMATTLLLSACDESSSPVPSAVAPVKSAVQAACEAAVSAQTGVGVGDVKSIMTTPEGDGTLTSVSVLGAVAPWNCRANSAGVVSGVEFSQEG